jgi:hypothetical protein
MITIIRATIVLWLFAFPAWAESALQVQSWCTAIVNAPIRSDGSFFLEATPESNFCWGAFAAVQGLSAGKYAGESLLRICAPTKSTRIEMIKIFSNFLNKHPEQSHLDFIPVAMCALWEAFPCPNTPRYTPETPCGYYH